MSRKFDSGRFRSSSPGLGDDDDDWCSNPSSPRLKGGLSPPRRDKQMLRRKSTSGNFDQETAASRSRSEQQEGKFDKVPRRRSADTREEEVMPERFRVPVRSMMQGQCPTNMPEEILKRHPLFKSANSFFVDQLNQSFTVELFNTGATILEEGENAHLLYFLHRGEVEVTVGGKKVATLSDGAFFGEMALLEKNAKRNATVTATTFCDCRVVHKSKFARLLKLFPAERAFFEVEADRRAANLAAVKSKETNMMKLRESVMSLAKPELEIIEPPEDHGPPPPYDGPYIADAYLITAMLRRARGAQETAKLHGTPAMPSMSITG